MNNTDEEKKESLKNVESNYQKMEIILSMELDESKIEALTEIEGDYSRGKVISTLKSDENKYKALNYLENEYSKLEIIEKLESDDYKFKALDLIIDESCKVKIINTFKSYDNKMVAYDTIMDDFYRKSILKNLKNNAEKRDAIVEKYVNEIMKAEIIATFTEENGLTADEVKLLEIKELKDEESKSIVITSLDEDRTKIKELENITDENYKAKILSSIKDDLLKIVELEKLDTEKAKTLVIESIKDKEKKVQLAKELKSEANKAKVIFSLKEEEIAEYLYLIKDDDAIIFQLRFCFDDNLKFKAIEQLSTDEAKLKVIKSFNDKNKQKAIELIEKEENKATIISELKKEEEKLKYIQEFDDDMSKAIVIASLSNDEIKTKYLESLKDGAAIAKIIGSFDSKEVIVKNLSKYKDYIDFGNMRKYFQDDVIEENFEIFFKDYLDKKEILLEMYKSNNSVLKDIDVRFLDNKYIDTLGIEKINQISCIPSAQKKLLECSDKEYEILVRCIDESSKISGLDTDWNYVFAYIGFNIFKGEYKELIESLDEVSESDIKNLMLILQNENCFCIKNIEDVRNYENLIKGKTDEMIKSDEVEEKKKAIFQKIYGHDVKYAKEIVKKFGTDICGIQDNDLKDYVKSLDAILNEDDPEILEEIYMECEECIYTNKALVQRRLKTEYLKRYNEGLFELSEATKVGENIYEAGTNFRMIMTSIAPYAKREITNYKDDWNKPSIRSQHFCTVYISNDMMAIPIINHVCYGFSKMADDSLMLAGDSDLYSDASGLITFAGNGNETYCLPDNLINRTESGRYGGNELDFRRKQDGKTKKPDYILVFRKNGKIDNMDEAQKASKQWGGMPIVIVDVDKCLEEQKNKALDLIEEYKRTKDKNTIKSAYQIIRNNRQTECTFMYEIEINYLIQEQADAENGEKKEVKISFEDLKENDEMVSEEERKSAYNKIRCLVNSKTKSRKKEISKEER